MTDSTDDVDWFDPSLLDDEECWRCGGVRWITIGDDEFPCPRCSDYYDDYWM